MVSRMVPVSQSTKAAIGQRVDLRHENRNLDEIALFRKYNLGLLGISITCGPKLHHDIADGVSSSCDVALDYFGKPYVGGVLSSEGVRQ